VWLPWRPVSARSRDAALATAFATLALIPALGPYGLALGELSTRADDAWRVMLILGQTLPLAARRRFPTACLAVVGTAFALSECLGYSASPAGLGVLFALYSVGAHQRRSRGLVAAAAAVAYAGLASALSVLGSPEQPWQLAVFGLVLAAAWGAGELVRSRAAAARSRAELGARAAVLEERVRLAGELHDVVSHHVTGMVVQADAAAFLLPAGDQAVRGQLAEIAEAGRRALDDLRRLLDVLGPDASTAGPTIGAIPDLVAAARKAGLDVELAEHGEAHGPDELRLAVYRVVQEGLTNARKHAWGAAVRVTVRWAAAHVRLVVATSAAGVMAGAGPRTPGSGRGLAGLRARVERLGGELRAAPTNAGGFVLEASLPLDPAPRLGDGDA
jgi:signal transduction histidine kinase